MIYNEQSENFLSEYGGVNFNDVKFRGEGSAQFTTKFGIDLSTPELRPLRLHFAIDRGNGANGQILVPFDCEKTDLVLHDSFGSIIRLFVKEADFEVRIMHCDPSGDIPKGVVEQLKKGAPLRRGEFLSNVGNLGNSFGRHTHVEIVSTGETSRVLDYVMERKKVKNQCLCFMDIIHIVEEEKRENNAPESIGVLLDWLAKEWKNRGVFEIREHSAVRVDYLTMKKKTFYDSRKLFGM